MVVTGRKMTVEEFERLPDDGNRYELVDGELRQMPGDGLLHGDVGSELIGRLWLHVRRRRIGRVYMADTRFRIFPDRPIIYGPDAAFVREDRLPLPDLDTYERIGQLAPDLVVEVVSPTDREVDVQDKVADYLAAGVRLVWLVRSRAHTITAHAPGREPVTYREGDVLDGGEVLPDFRVPVNEIFELV
jgi:Uma2 family endonuclease